MSWFSVQDLWLALMTLVPACAALVAGVEVLVRAGGGRAPVPAQPRPLPPAPVVLEHVDAELGELVGVR